MWKFKQYFSPFTEGMHFFGDRVSAIVNSLLLGVVYFIGIGIPSILARIKGKNFLEVELDRQAASYWRPIHEGNEPLKRYLRQF